MVRMLLIVQRNPALAKKSLYSPKTILLFSIIKAYGPEPLKTKMAQEHLKLKVCACQSPQVGVLNWYKSSLCKLLHFRVPKSKLSAVLLPLGDDANN